MTSISKRAQKNMDKKAWVVAMDMGYGHQRAAYPLHDIAEGGRVLYADNYSGMPSKDREIWKQQLDFYNKVSRAKKLPIIGDFVFGVFDKFQEIKPFYPKRDLSRPSTQGRSTYLMIRKKEWGKHLIKKLSKNPIPMITTFFVLAYMAEEHGYPGDIYLVVTDADVSRAWAPLHPENSKIKYLAPTKRVYERLQLYGIRKSQIYLTGFPLPDENLGGEKLTRLKKDLGRRMVALDPDNQYIPRYRRTLEKYIGKDNIKNHKKKPLTITFAVGGAGAQREMGISVVKSLQQMIKNGTIRVVLVAGVHADVKSYFETQIEKLHLSCCLGNGIEILYLATKEEYFKAFNEILSLTDVLWTKPSELSFYCALGIPIIMSDPIGSQEKFNRKWLRSIGAGIEQENVKYTNEWLSDWLESGWLAEAAVQGFFEAPKYGTYNIQKIIKRDIDNPEQLESFFQY